MNHCQVSLIVSVSNLSCYEFFTTRQWNQVTGHRVWTCVNYLYSIRIQPNNIINYSYSKE